MIVTQTELAVIFGVTPTTIWSWGKAGMPIVKMRAGTEGNEYDTKVVFEWLVARAVKKAAGEESQRDRLTRFQADAIERANAAKESQLVPAAEIEPTWRVRVLGAACFISSSPSRIAQEIEALPGIEAKRRWLKEEFVPSFLTRLGVDGARMQATVEAIQAFLIKLVSSGDAHSKEAQGLLWRLASDQDEPGAVDPGGHCQ